MADRKATRVGQELGPYRLTRLLGAGGFGEVYEAEHRLLQQRRALKLLLERHFHDPKSRERFLREARTLAALEHPNILPVLELGEADNLFYLVMPLYSRGTLKDRLQQHTAPLSLAEVETYLAQMCAALGYAHANNVVHLDLKPENMLLHDDGRLVLSDFGLAHLIKQGRLEAGTSASWGTPYYMAPEHIRGEPEPRSDLYALGIILYQLLTGHKPFTGSTPEAVILKQIMEPPPPLRTFRPDIPPAVDTILQTALAKKPEERFQTAAALLTAFRLALGHQPFQQIPLHLANPPASPARQPGPPPATPQPAQPMSPGGATPRRAPTSAQGSAEDQELLAQLARLLGAAQPQVPEARQGKKRPHPKAQEGGEDDLLKQLGKLLG